MNDQDIKEIKQRLQGRANHYYIRYTETLKDEKCLGLQYKIDNQLFTIENLRKFEDAYDFLGQHKAYIAAMKLIDEYLY